LDGVLLAGLLVANAALWVRTGGEPAAGLEVVSAAGSRSEPLSGPRDLEVAGPLGATAVRVEPDGARVTDSPCPQKLCVAAGKISRPGEVVACLPNRVALRITGARAVAVDAVGR
jgi:hypothetical protein